MELNQTWAYILVHKLLVNSYLAILSVVILKI